MTFGLMAFLGMSVAAVVNWRWKLGWGQRLVCMVWCATVRAVKFILWKCRRAPVTFGSSRWLKSGEASKVGLLGDKGLIIGKLGRRMLRFPDVEGSVIVFAPQGAGKGVGIVVPNLLTYEGSVICTDPKGENFAVTARQRATYGPVYCVYVANPDNSHRFNPMDAVSRDELKSVDDCRRSAELLMPMGARDDDSHWRKRSVSILTGFLLYVLEKHGDDAGRCNLATVDALLSAPLSTLKDTLDAMQTSSQLVVRSMAALLQNSLGTEEGLNLLSNISKGTEIWGEGRVLGRIGRSSDFNLETDIVGRVASLFVSVPEDMKAVYAPFMRVMVGLTLHAVARVGKTGVGANRPLFMLDEAASLGAIPELEEGIGHLRAYARAVLIFQDMAQLRATYRKWESVISNAACQVAFGVNDDTTAEKFSRMLGDRTVEVKSMGVNTGGGTVLAENQSAGIGESGRRLMQASELLRMNAGQSLVLMRGVPHPILATRVKYFEEKALDGMYDRWRDGTVVPLRLMIEHKALRIEQKPLRLEHKPLRIGYKVLG